MDKLLEDKLTSLIRVAIKGDELPGGFTLSTDEALTIYKYANRHDVSHLVSMSLDKTGLMNTRDEILKPIRQSYLKAIKRSAMQDFCLNELGKCFQKHDIKYIPLKGSVLKYLYPESWMRTSSDIDIMVQKCDYRRAISLLETECGYSPKDECAYHYEFSTGKDVVVELHQGLMDEHDYEIADVVDEIWKSAVPADEKNPCHMKMQDEWFYFHHILHMMRHFEDGGCGIRFFIDTWILNDSKTFLADDESTDFETLYKKRCDRLAKAGLDKFEKAAVNLSRYWLDGKDSVDAEFMSGGEFIPPMDIMREYVILAGTHGATEQKLAYKQVKSGGKGKYILSRIFMPYDHLKLTYPILEKHKLLTPIFEVVRWVRLIFNREESRTSDEITAMKHNSQVEYASTNTNNIKSMKDMLGI